MGGVVINGVIWATRNVDKPGTFVKNPEDAGMFYQWNRNIGWSATSPMINSNGDTVWDSSIPTGDIWEASNNVCPAGWRVPTITELINLAKSGNVWTTQNDVSGRLFGRGNNTIFLPASGHRNELGTLRIVGVYGGYWSSSHINNRTLGLFFRSCSASAGNSSRHSGFSVRCVAE